MPRLRAKWQLIFFIVIVFIAIIPVITLFFVSILQTGTHTIANNTLWAYVSDSLVLVAGVLVLTLLIGVGSAYLLSFYSFYGAGFFSKALLLSFAIPTYIYAYSFNLFFENFGTAHTLISVFLGPGNYNAFIPKPTGMFGAIFSISLSLFTYLYLLTKTSFEHQSQHLIDVSSMLQFSKRRFFLTVVLPGAKYAIITGVVLISMETLSDFGAVSQFGISTITTAIYNTWLYFDDWVTASQLAMLLLSCMIVFLFLEGLFKKSAGYHTPVNQAANLKTLTRLKGFKGFVAFSWCFILFLVGFLIPVMQLGYWSVVSFSYHTQHMADIITASLNTLLLAIVSAFFITICGLISNVQMRLHAHKTLRILHIFSMCGYIIPGLISAISFIVFINWLNQYFVHHGIDSFKSLWIGSIMGLIILYFMRFYPLSFRAIESTYKKINKHVDESARLMKYSQFKLFQVIHLPYLRHALCMTFFLMIVETLKDLPIILVNQPFNFQTLSLKIYKYISQDLIELAAFPSLIIITICAISLLLFRTFLKKNNLQIHNE